MYKHFLTLSLILLSAHSTQTEASTVKLDQAKFDDIVQRTMKEFKVPGVAVGIIKNGKILVNKGYGIRNILNKKPVNKDTIFKIASNSKAFTSAALAILVDQGKITWQTKVIDFIPQFTLYDPWVTKEFTVIDLLTHRSGLARFAGDLMLWPEPAGFSRDEIIRNIRHLQPDSSFRSEYAYDNLLYIVAGELIAEVSGISWEAFVEKNILSPLAMEHCFAGKVASKFMDNVAEPHGFINDKLHIIQRSQTYDKDSVMAAAGGIKCSVNNMLTWVDTQLKQGRGLNDLPLFSKEQSDMMWSPYTILKVSNNEKQFDNTHFKSYGLGWRLADVHGYKSISHTGTLSGSMSYMTLIPELDLGVVVMINRNSGETRNTIMSTIIKTFMGVEQKDWLAINKAKLAAKQRKKLNAKSTLTNEINPNKSGSVLFPLSTYVGIYEDPWFGAIKISQRGDSLFFESLKSLRMQGKMVENKHNQFIVYWTDRTLEADAFANFIMKGKKAIGLKMDHTSSEADLSFDYIDLNFIKK